MGHAKSRARLAKCCLSIRPIEIRTQSMPELAHAHSRHDWSTYALSEARCRCHAEKNEPSVELYKIRRRSAMGRTSVGLIPCWIACALGRAESRARLGKCCRAIKLIENRQQSIQGLTPAQSRSIWCACDVLNWVDGACGSSCICAYDVVSECSSSMSEIVVP